MTNIQPFDFRGHEVRVLVAEDGEPRWVASDVAKILEFSATSAMTRYLDEEEKGVCLIGTPSGDQEMTIISESGLYSAILRSRKPEAKEFKRWVTGEVLPSIRKTGSYGAPALPKSMSEALRLAADEYDRAELERARADKAEKKAEIESKYRKAHEAGDGITVSDFGRKYFSEEQYMQVFEHLYKHDYLIDQRGTRTTKDGKKKDGYDHMKPKAKGRKFFYLHGNGVHGGKQRHRTRVRPQMEIALRDALIREGLSPNTHSTGLVLFNAEDMKEISA